MQTAPRLYIERDTSKYVVDGRRVPSVTEVLALAGVVDFSGIGADVLAQAAQRGRAAHRVTALHDLGEDPSKDEAYEETAGYLEGYLRFLKDTGFKPTLIEYSMVSKEFRYAGTLDRLGVARDGWCWIVDLKTSIGLAAWVALQLAGYDQLARPMLETTRMRRMALRLKKDGTYTITEYADRSDFPDFLACNRVAHWRLNKEGIALP
jgi:hypothetical protein